MKHFTKSIIGLILSYLLMGTGCSSSDLLDPNPARGFWSARPAAGWEQSLLTGNGTMGALVMGEPLADTIILSHAKLYMPLNEPLPPVNTGEKPDTIRRMMLRGRYGEASQYVVDLSHREGWGGKRWTDPFVPAFDIRIQMLGDTAVSDYKRGVDFASGEAFVTWKGARGTYRRQVFASRPDTLLVVRICGPGKGTLNGRISLADRPKDHSWWQEFYNSTHRISRITAEKGWLLYQCRFDQEWEGSVKGAAGAVRILHRGGSLVPDSTGIRMIDADEILMLVRVDPSRDKNRLSSGALLSDIRGKLSPVNMDYQDLINRNRKVHGELFGRVALDLNGGADRSLPVEELLERSAHVPVPALLEKEFDAARYNILCATGIMPPNLQGIWAGTTAPPWSGDFTQNGNLEVAVAGLLPGNMPELMDALFRYEESLLPDYRENARRLYGARGIDVASRTSTHGLNNHFDRTWPMTFWTAGAAWLAEFFYDYYRYTGDRDFLRARALPFMQEADLFYRDFLLAGPDGKWIFNPSYSPENNPGNSPDQACINATMDVAAAKQLYRNLIEAGGILGLSPDTIAAWQGMLDRMPAYEINADGALREYMWDSLTDNYAHRHASHLYGLWDVTDPEIGSSPALMEAARKAVDERMKVRRQEDGGVMAFGMVQLALAAAAVGDSVAVQDMINWLGSVYWFPNLVTAHNPHELFNLDLSGGFPAVIIKSLVYAEPGRIRLLPACPPAWRSGEIRGVLLRGGITLESLKWGPEGIRIRMKSKTDQTVRVEFPGAPAGREIVMKGGEAMEVVSS